MSNTDTTTITRHDAFATLGTPLLSTTSAQEALEAGGLAGWNVRKAPVFATDPISGQTIEMPDRRSVIFDRPDGGLGYLGDVGRQHTTIQNEEQIEVMNLFATEAGATFETAGIARGGRKVFVTMKLPGHYRIGGTDLVDNYVAGLNSHDGSAFKLMVTPLRFACMNMLNVALPGASQLITVRHTRAASAKLREEVLAMLDQTFIYLDEFQATAERLAATDLSIDRFQEIIEREFGAGEEASAAAITRAENRTGEMLSLFSQSASNSGIRDTAWAGFNALTEWSDHFAPTRGDDPDASRAERAIYDPAFKNRALDIMLGVAA